MSENTSTSLTIEDAVDHARIAVSKLYPGKIFNIVLEEAEPADQNQFWISLSFERMDDRGDAGILGNKLAEAFAGRALLPMRKRKRLLIGGAPPAVLKLVDGRSSHEAAIETVRGA